MYVETLIGIDFHNMLSHIVLVLTFQLELVEILHGIQCQPFYEF